MKIIITSQGSRLDDQVDPRFGRAKQFILADTESGQFAAHDNAQNLNAPQGAGIQAAQAAARLGAEAVLTGHVGPKAFAALSAAGIKVGQDLDGLTVAEAVERYRAGQVPMAAGPNK